jgi:membrane glycosyltransferase
MFRLPGTKLQVRVFDRVETKNDQYDVFDIGVQHADGGIDSVVVGGSFHTAKTLLGGIDKKAAKKAKKAEKKAKEKAAAKAQKKADKKAAKRLIIHTSTVTSDVPSTEATPTPETQAV